MEEAKKLETVNYVSIEGGEPFLYYPIMIWTMKKAVNLGFDVEIFSNGYWATCVENSIKWLTPMSKAKNVKISLSSDLYYAEKWISEEAKNAVKAANALNIKISIIAVKYPSVVAEDLKEVEDVKVDLWELMLRGGASSTLVDKANKKTWSEFTKCPYEDFTRQKRVHVDPLGYVHVCQGISIGNTYEKPLSEIIGEYDP